MIDVRSSHEAVTRLKANSATNFSGTVSVSFSISHDNLTSPSFDCSTILLGEFDCRRVLVIRSLAQPSEAPRLEIFRLSQLTQPLTSLTLSTAEVLVTNLTEGESLGSCQGLPPTLRRVFAKDPIAAANQLVDRRIRFRSRGSQPVSIVIGKVETPTNILVANIRSLLTKIVLTKPKGPNIRSRLTKIVLTSTMSPSINLMPTVRQHE